MEKVPNPARWLLRIWGRLSGDGSQTALVGWATTFGLSHNDPRVLSALVAVVDIVGRTSRATSKMNLPGSVKAQMSSWVEAFDNVLARVATNEPWKHTRGQFTDVRREKLEMCATWFDEICAPQEETDAEVVDIDSAIKSLLEAIQGSEELDDAFRELLLDVLESLRRALAEYEIRGMHGVDAAIGDIFAAILRRQEIWKKGQDEWKVRLWRVVDRSSKLGSIARLGVAAVEFTQYLIQHIG